jgi:cytochrome c oxidase subunit II
VQGSPSYDPAALTVKKGDKITVTNKDTLPHTVTSGTGPTDPNSAKQFDTSIIEAGATADIETANMNAGEYPFHCTVHPYMMGKLVVQ